MKYLLGAVAAGGNYRLASWVVLLAIGDGKVNENHRVAAAPRLFLTTVRIVQTP